MNKPLMKLSIAMAGLVVAGAAHAVTVYTVPVSGSVSIPTTATNTSDNSTLLSNGYTIAVSSTGTVELDFSASLSKSKGGNVSDLSVTYEIFNSNGTQQLGSTGALTTSTGGGSVIGSISDLSLVAGTDYLLKIILGGKTILSATALSDSVSAVPLPGTALLFGTALLGAGALRYRGKKSKTATKSNPAMA